MDDDNAERYLNNFSTDAPPNTYEIDRLSTEIENSENESVKSNGRISNPIPTCVSKKIPITINCSTVNFQSDVDNQLAVATITASSPEPNMTNNRIVTPSTNEKKGENSRCSILTTPLIIHQQKHTSVMRFY